MASISKNIKRLRTEKGITQETFAKTINVSRQAVSSWETGRTQPDIDMLGTLSEALGVSVEELIYGERRNVKIDNEEKNYASTATIVMSIFGGLLLFSGAILILIWCWEHLPEFAKGVFSVTPMALGIALAAVIFVKMKNDASMMEFGSAAAVIGNVASVIFVNILFELDLEEIQIGLILIAVTFPVLFIMKSVVALTGINIMVLYMAVEGKFYVCLGREIDYIRVVVFWVGVIALSCLFTEFYKKQLGFSRYRYAQWVNILSVIGFVWFNYINYGFINPYVPLISVFAICYIKEKENDLTSPLYLFGTLGSMITLILCLNDEGDSIGADLIEECLSIAVFVVPFLVAVFVGRNSLKENVFKKWQIIIFGINMLLASGHSAVWVFLTGDEIITYEIFVTVAYAACIFASGIAFIIQGLKQNKLYPLNLGFASIAALIFIMFTGLVLDGLIKGFVLLIMGGVFIFMNLKITKGKEKEKIVNNSEPQTIESTQE